MNEKEILSKFKTIAVFGFSNKSERDSNKIAKLMLEKGYKVFGINPILDGKNVDGIQCFADIDSIPEKVEIADIFRRADMVPEIVNKIVESKNLPEVIWVQLGIESNEAKNIAERNGFIYIENKCIYVEYKKNFEWK